MRNDVTRFGTSGVGGVDTGAGGGGVTNAALFDALASIGTLDPTKYHVLFEDFDRYTSTDWVLTETQAGATQAMTSGDGGRLLLTNSAADDDLVALQWAGGAGSVIPTFTIASNKRLAVGCRFQVSDATQSDVAFGLYVADTSPIASFPTDGVFFYKADGAATGILKCGASSSYTNSGTVATLSSATMVDIVFVYEGILRTDNATNTSYYDFICYVNNAQSGVLSVASTGVPSANLALSFAIQNGEAVAKTMTVDWLFAIKER